jgi:ABC-2 type transport system ATP-binding protein/lipopolysaccharide transport system ATP-binding protein
MTYVLLDSVSITFPVHTEQTRSLRRSLIAPRIGAFFRSTENSKLVCIDALSNVSFRLEAGDRLGLLGHNGSGKSTLLRVIAGVYAPTGGRLTFDGQRLAFFDLGQGVHPESSGRENIMALGLLQGRTRAEILAAIEKIIEFSGLEDYIDLPVRTYSTGMAVRLAFAVKTYWQADILLLDEVIGAGDTAFFEKARGRVVELAERAGIAVIASHATDVLAMLCTKGLVMSRGQCQFLGPIDEAIAFYHGSLGGPQ